MTRRMLVVGLCVATAVTGCSFRGVNSLPLPGSPGRVPGAATYYVDIKNVGSLESNSPVLIDDVEVGSVGNMTVDNWHANVVVLVKPGVVVPANAVATVGQTSLLGSSHLSLNPPPGVAPEGRLSPGTTIELNASSTYPSTEQTLASLSAVVTGGGLGQIGDVISNFATAFDGRQQDVRDLITNLDKFVGTLDAQRDNIIATIQSLNRLAGTFAGQRDVLTEALQKLPPALDVLVRERPLFTTALERLRLFSDTTAAVISDVHADLVENLHHLEPTLRAVADAGTVLDEAVQFALTFPYGQGAIDRFIKGDYLNLSATVDLTIPRLEREILMGTRWGDPTQEIQAAIGDPGFVPQTSDPLGIGVAPPPAVIPGRQPEIPPPPLPGFPPVPVPTSPVTPPPSAGGG